ncbi:MAG TPA: pyridoxal phosphate-dependent aminotransferase [Solirubrobacteraceae bacterium]|nr:pyridoxal phosphate-dependent aminotransferase [Solirubrobacteraceae bacterium]
MIRRLRDYYRQFEELSQDEISRELRERRDAERARALSEVPPLDLASATWYQPPDAEAVNAATYALRRAVNAYPDDGPLREALARRHGLAPAQVAAGHGAGELLHAAFRAIAAEGEVAIAWPGWGPLPRLVHEAGGTPVPVPPELDALAAAGARAVVLCSPNDPTGVAIEPGELEAFARELDESAWLVVDAALAEFAPQEPDAGALLAVRERVLVVRSFSKAHAMAGFRAGYALAGDEDLLDRLTPAGGVSAPAQAAMLWAVAQGDAVVGRRRAAAARERERLGEQLDGTPFSFPAGHGPLVWLASAEQDGATVARHLAAQRIFVTPGQAWGDQRHVRVTLRDGGATDRLAAALLEL